MTAKEAEEFIEDMHLRDIDHTNSELDDAPSTLPGRSAAGIISQARQEGPEGSVPRASRPHPPMVNESFARIANPRSNSSFMRSSRPAAPPAQAPIVQQSVEYRNARPENSSIDTVVEGRNGVVPLYAGHKNDSMV